MSLDLMLMSALADEGLPGIKLFTENKVDETLFMDDDARKVFSFVIEFWQTYNSFPSRDVIEGRTGVSLLTVTEPLSFYVKEIVDRAVFSTMTAGVSKVFKSLELGDLAQARTDFVALSADIAAKDTAQARLVSFADVIPEIKDRYALIKSGKRGILTPWETLNDATLGFWAEELILIVARSGVGKTWLLILLSLCALIQGKVVLFGTTEVSREVVAARFVAAYGKIPYADFRSAKLNIYQEENLWNILDEMSKLTNFYLLGGDFDFQLASFELAIRESGCDMAILDGAYLAKGKGPNRTEQLADVFNDLKRIAKRNRIVMLASNQLNRGAKKDDPKAATQENVALSDVAVWNSDQIWAIIQSEDMKSDGKAILKNLKLREGYCPEVSINWDFTTMNFEEVSGDEGTDADFDAIAGVQQPGQDEVEVIDINF